MKRSKVVWQPPAHCRIMALNSTLQPHVHRLERALDREIQIVADIKREDFFNIITEDAWYYIHLYGSAIYLVAYLPLARQPARKVAGDATEVDENRLLKEPQVVSG